MKNEKSSTKILSGNVPGSKIGVKNLNNKQDLQSAVLFITTYPPRECGIATYSQDLIKALKDKFEDTFSIRICAIDPDDEVLFYDADVQYSITTKNDMSLTGLANSINLDASIKIVMIQHEFGLFHNCKAGLLSFLKILSKPLVLCFHTVLPSPDPVFKQSVIELSEFSQAIIVMTKTSSKILMQDYGLPESKINVIPHGTHLIAPTDKNLLKKKYDFSGRQILSTFGLLSSGKSIETTLDALPEIIKTNDKVLFLIIGKTHPTIYKNEQEHYRDFLEAKIIALNLQNHVQLVNAYLPLPVLLDYLQLTDIYLFTSKDPNQAVSGTFAYAFSCGCPIISTPIPHALEVLKNNAGIIVNFGNSPQLTLAVNQLLQDEECRNNMSLNGLHLMAATAWENTAISHAKLFEAVTSNDIVLQFKIPAINLCHFKNLSTDFGMIQFSKINQPDISSGYTLDDNARALVAICQYIELFNEVESMHYLRIYLNFIKYSFQGNGFFYNYINKDQIFTGQNSETNLEDANGRAIWALGYLLSLQQYLPSEIIEEADVLMTSAILKMEQMHSTRAMAFSIKGLYYYNQVKQSIPNIKLTEVLANRLVQMYKHEANADWQWFESYLTYGNSILPEAMLCAWLVTGNAQYKEIAFSSMDFLVAKIFTEKRIQVISNKGWLQKETAKNVQVIGGEQPIDVAYTILALYKFYFASRDERYYQKIQIAFSWFLGNNHLQQIIYNPSTGGCYDGLEEDYINLNQGAESTVSYLMARLTIEKMNRNKLHLKVITNQYKPVNNLVKAEA